SETYPDDEGLFAAGVTAGEEIAKAYDNFDTAKAMRLVMALADKANEYVDRKQPWSLRKQAGQERALQDVCTVALNLYRQIVVYLSPVLPQLALDSALFLNATVSKFADAKMPTVGHPIGEFKPLLQRIDPKSIAAV